MFLLILLLEVVAALALGMMISAAAATPELAVAIGIPVTIISFVFAGFYSKLFCTGIGSCPSSCLNPANCRVTHP
jgi:hypothetical protein